MFIYWCTDLIYWRHWLISSMKRKFGQAIGLYRSYGSTDSGILIWKVYLIKKYQIDWSDLLVNWLCWSYGRSTYWYLSCFFDFANLIYWLINWSKRSFYHFFGGDIFLFREIHESFGFNRSFFILDHFHVNLRFIKIRLLIVSKLLRWNDRHYSQPDKRILPQLSTE